MFSSTYNELIDINKMKEVIQQAHLRYLSRIDVFEKIDSTNTYLMQQAKKEAPVGSVCIAEVQTAGRGRRGRVWDSPSGNIYCSLLWSFQPQPPALPSLSIAIAVMIARVLKSYGVQNGLELKWPNDILFSGRKLAGILIEIVKDKLIIGFGINIIRTEEQDRISLEELLGQPVARHYLIGMVLDELIRALPFFQRGGLNSFIREWQALDVLQGKKMTVQAPQYQLIGVAQGINERGELQVKALTGELHVFSVGEISCRVL